MNSTISQALAGPLGPRVRRYGPGLLVSATIALAAQFLSDHYGAPALLMALLLGMAFHFLSGEGACVPGIELASKKVLRIGVALLGVRISVELLQGLGPGLIALVIGAVVLTMLSGLAISPLLGRGWRLGVLTGGSVAICGASAALALASVLPKNEHSERNLVFTVFSVTILSTVAMVLYPMITAVSGLDARGAGVFLGGTIHDVAQVVGAGYSVSDEVGDTATTVKLIRVTLMLPVVLFISMVARRVSGGAVPSEGRPPLLPFFLIGFVILAAINSFGVIPAPVVDFVSAVSRWALLAAIAATGMKTSLARMREVGTTAVILIVSETVFLAALILVGYYVIA